MSGVWCVQTEPAKEEAEELAEAWSEDAETGVPEGPFLVDRDAASRISRK